MNTFKTCTKCKQLKPLSEFPKDNSRKDGLYPWCKSCNCAHADDWYKKNRERACKRKLDHYWSNRDMIRERVHGYYIKHREKHLEKCRQYREANREKIREYFRRHWQERPDRGEKLEYIRAWRKNNPKLVARYNSKWQRNNPLKHRAMQNKRRAQKRNAGGIYSAEEFQALIDHYGNHCLCCGKQSELVVDHVIALRNGGMNSIDNIQPLCRRCNSSKGAHHNTDYRPDGGEFAYKLARKRETL